MKALFTSSGGMSQSDVQVIVDQATNNMQNTVDQTASSILHPSRVAVAADKVLALTDAGTIQRVSAAAVITVPPNATVDFPDSTQITILAATNSVISVAADSGVTIHAKDNKMKLDGQFAAATLIKDETEGIDFWWLIGALKA